MIIVGTVKLEKISCTVKILHSICGSGIRLFIMVIFLFTAVILFCKKSEFQQIEIV